jgi:hypothetical protein
MRTSQLFGCGVLALFGSAWLGASSIQAAARPSPPPFAAQPAPSGPGACQFILGFATLHEMIPAESGACLEDQYFAPNGDAWQHTTKGLFAWRKGDNRTTFTNGYQTWLNGPGGLVKRFNDEWFEWEAYPAETNGVPVNEDPPAPVTATEVSLGPLLHIDQTLNNCGPASIAEVLRYYGITHSQTELKGILRPDNPYGMFVDPIAPYVSSIGLKALLKTGATDGLLKALIRNGLPPIVEDNVSAADTRLHYRALEGYDDARGIFIAADTLLGPRHAISYAEFDQVWRPTKNQIVVIYPAAKQAALNAALAGH